MGVTFALNFNWPLIKKTMDQESMTAFGFLHIKHFFRKNSNLSSLALSDTFMGRNIRFVPCLPYVWPKFARVFLFLRETTSIFVVFLANGQYTLSMRTYAPSET